ncbi:MAG TPA: hypothetical protein VGF53_09305 [Pseudolabrys sp.]|jgi:hypothetical protein
MRALHHIVAIAAVVVFVVAVRTVAPATVAGALVAQGPSVNILQMQEGYLDLQNLPAQKIHDMTFVFAAAE